MSFNEQAARAFLEGGDFDEDKAKAFLSDEPKRQDSGEEAALETYLTTTKPKKTPKQDDFARIAGEFSNAANAVAMNVLGLPGDAVDFVYDKIGLDSSAIPLPTSDTLRKRGQQLGISYGEGEIPETPATKAGEYTGLGLTFLAPMLNYGKGALEAVKAGKTVLPSSSIRRGVAERMTAPFITNPYTSSVSEVAGSVGAGVGAYYGKQEFGQVGEIIGGIVGGLTAIPVSFVSPYVNRYIHKNTLAATKIGGKVKAGDRIRQLAETPDIDTTITREQGKILQRAEITPAKLSGDRHLISLENEIRKTDPSLDHKLILAEFKNNKLAMEELKAIGGDVPITQTQAHIRAKVNHVKELVNRKVDLALAKSYEALSDVAPQTQRKAVNTVVKSQIDDALGKARSVEREMWNKVKQDVIVPTSSTKETFKKEILNRADAADPEDIPTFLNSYLGKVEKGAYKQGKWGSEQTVKEMQALRSRVLDQIRNEKAKDAPNWNKVRILDDVQENILKDLESAGQETGVREAIAVSRDVNRKFSGGIMDIIYGQKRTGGKVAPEISLSTIRSGPKAAVEIKKVLEASPESKPMIEELVKLNLAQSKAINTRTGRVNVPMAKRYMLENEDVFELFPKLRDQMDTAIALEERAIGTKEIAKSRLDKISRTSASKVAEAKPKRVWAEITTSENPALAAKKAMDRSNYVGKRGIKSDAIDFLIGKSKTGKLDDDGIHILSGRKFKNEFESNASVFKEVFDSDELKRLQTISETLVKNEGFSSLPEVGGVISPQQGPIAYAIVTLATRAGSKLGEGTSGAALRTASTASRLAQSFLDRFDVYQAQKILKDAVTDPELYKAIYADTSKPQELNQAIKVIQGWMVAHAIESLEEN